MSNEDLQRRRRDLEKTSDHDLLIAHSVKINQICITTKAIEEKLDVQIEKADTRCVLQRDRIENSILDISKKVDSKLDTHIFQWLFGILILLLIGLFATIGGTWMTYNELKKDTDLAIKSTQASMDLTARSVQYNSERILEFKRALDKAGH